ncbi:ScbA/BarX family gamma-butyrolactone biosynthesis protein [Kitasatospora sp. LaBMicrA B282]|uniref:ScbA/BarX family gamma-butyrolactone biosynthesis protein n=1 Tax=Kitasatospora sp. LaBMicrA B282 TaxID=3420949 RepID=UPI003D0E1AA1
MAPSRKAAVPPMTSDISFRRTVDRALVHRYAVSEVFITDLVEAGPDRALIGAQLPLSHSYFLDSSDDRSGYGATLLTECARQACTYLAHTRYDVPLGWSFLMSEMSVQLTGDHALRVSDRPAELTMAAQTRTELRDGRLRTLWADLELLVDGAPAGRITGEGRYLTREEYEFLRLGPRTGAVPLSSALPVRPEGVPVPPALVGRRDPRNVLLVDARRIGHALEARLGVPGNHPTIFDHPLDHYPGMALIEAAGQAALLALALEHPGGGWDTVLDLRATFSRFAELDADISVRARAEQQADGSASAAVGFRQGGETLAEFRLLVARSGS